MLFLLLIGKTVTSCEIRCISKEFIQYSNFTAATGSTAMVSVDQFNDGDGSCRTHVIVLVSDNRHHISTLRHTWEDDSSHSDVQCAEFSNRYMQYLNESTRSQKVSMKERNSNNDGMVQAADVPHINLVAGLRVMTYNIWHTNPPSWHIHSSRYTAIKIN